MEDHLKNKNRLEREWEALCSYQAEPSTCSVGKGEQNSKRNRSDAVVVCKYPEMSVVLLFIDCENAPVIYNAVPSVLLMCLWKNEEQIKTIWVSKAKLHCRK